ncbi:MULTISPECIES: thiamine pyrophosphate-binding protein [unclassified Paenibacillus]|uniref:thiamine pyrophosphate-binding protein n=1 Tax=unclassified Paenibacillus TaxID=185978 RepID=UPI001AE4138F|nr:MULTISPECIES: thiamine pyrophosphate-binding protein [unclassified Paenibacillus]MBP1155838.1 acetolactate synthase-1/2/3 large subunit [Paenibacillus sp. PvP091]MBP1168776.1 acetolactate synthase-1/2/3 large subunit [Paenibacillus sp. PvR098]MBP2439804.1 acetolactate synthase-1/2/3 large subunit [Paenibacillus sp. PvP052]
MKLGEAITKKLGNSEIDTVFGIPGGGSSSDLLCYMGDHDMKFILTQNETTAAIMGSVYGEVTGKPGVCLTDLGPGALSMSTGLAYALLDRAPLITLSDRYGSENVDYALRQKISHTDAFKPITKLTSSLSASNWSSMLHRGYTVAMTPKRGPVHFDIPNDLINREVDEDIGSLSREAYLLTADEKSLKNAASLIQKAKFPVVIVGLTINNGNGSQYEQLRKFVEAFQIPVFKTAKAKGSLSDQHELSLGVFMGGRLETGIMEQCDLIVAIGLDPVELLPKKWRYNQPVVYICDDPNDQEMYRAEAEVIGDIGISLDLIGDYMTDSNNQWQSHDITQYRNQVKSALETSGTILTADKVIRVSQEELPADVLMTTDVGASKLLVIELWESINPQSFFISNGLATMGFALPAAMALQHVFPNKVVVSLTGDGGFMMRLPDISTAVQNRWPVISIVFSDRRLSLMDVKQVKKGYNQPFGTEFVAPDYVKFAESFGANGWSVDTEDELRQAIRSALGSTNGMPSIIEARIDPSSYHKQFEAIREL